MKYETFAPPPHLAAHVRYFWMLEGKGPYVHRSMASGSPELVFHYKGGFGEIDSRDREYAQTALLLGPLNKFRRFSTEEDFGIFGAFLYPFALPDLFGHAADALANEMVDIEALMGKEGAEISERILFAGDNRERRGLLTQFLENRLFKLSKAPSDVDVFVRSLIHQPDRLDIEEAAQQYGCSRRQLERRFKSRAGFSPKHYARISRFQAALNSYGGRIENLADIAFSFGYYDQSHFSSEFRQFSGHKPRDYFLGKAEGTEWREA